MLTLVIIYAPLSEPKGTWLCSSSQEGLGPSAGCEQPLPHPDSMQDSPQHEDSPQHPGLTPGKVFCSCRAV